MSTTDDSFEKKSIFFENRGAVELLYVKKELGAPEIMNALNLPPSEAAIIVGGSTSQVQPRLKNRLLDLISRGVAQAALEAKAILIDEGTNTGVSEIVGQGVADRGRKTSLVGVLPKGTKAGSDGSAAETDQSLDANHTHFILHEQERQAVTMCRLAETASTNKARIITVLVGGELEGTALDLALETARRAWPLVVIEASGPLADEIVRIKKAMVALEKRIGRIWKWFRSSDPNPLAGLRETNPRLYEVISDGKILIVGPDFDAIQLRNLIKGLFQPPREKILWTAWQRFAEYDKNSSRHRDDWRRLRNVPLYLGVLSTLLVLIHSTTALNPNLDSQALAEGAPNQLWAAGYTAVMRELGNTINTQPWLDLLLRITIILLPIIASIFLGVETRLKLGSKYLVLRGAAESVKRGIYSFRVLKGRVKDSPEVILPYNEQGLATHLGKISKLLTDSDVNEAAFAPYGGPIPPNMFGAEAYDDGFSPLDPETYVQVRIGDQLKFYTLRTNQYERRIRRLQYLMLALGGVGTFLAAIGAQYWLPLTAAIVAAATAYLEYQQFEQILTKYNLTKSSLESVQANWQALSEVERQDPKKIQSLVRDVEAILESENQGWVQYINQAQEPQKESSQTTQGEG